jgi:high-affinity iron transporter
MLATLLIVFREMLEAGLIIGIILAATRGTPHRARWVAYGIVGGLAGACMVAVFADSINGMMEGVGQELFNASVMGIAVLMLVWHNVWMARQGRHIARDMKYLGTDVMTGKRSLCALAIVIGVAMLREGSEVVLFLYGIALSGGESIAAMMTGGAVGIVLGGVMSAMMYFGLLRIPTRHVFAATSTLIAFLAAGMAAQATVFLEQAGWINHLTYTVWDTSFILSDSSMMGKALHTLVGYTDRPSAMQLVVYLATLGAIFLLMKLLGHTPAAPVKQDTTQHRKPLVA